MELANCPVCHRPWHEDTLPQAQDRRTSSPDTSAGFVNPDYFRMLAQSLPSLDNSSGPPSPRRRLVQPSQHQRDSPGSSPPNTGLRNAFPLPESTSPGISASAFSQDYFKRFFVEERELGRGGKGVVLLVRHVLDGVTLGQFACKRVPVGDDHEWLRKVLVEVQLLQYLSHQHLVSYRHVWLEDVKLSNFGPSVPCAFILQQFCNSGDLHHYVSNTSQMSESTQQMKERMRRRSKNQPEIPRGLHGRVLPFEEIYSFFKDITSGLNHLHVNNYIHRDLKPSNCLLHDSGKGLRVLVSDFGEVQVENMVRKSTGATGTISYCAPEVLRREYPSGAYGNFTTKSDIFSLGMILYFLCFARLPYQNANVLNEDQEDLNELRDEITSWSGLQEERKLRPDLPEKLYTFLRRLLSLNVADRPSAEDILLAIKTGSGLDEIADSRPSSSGHRFDDLRNSARISPVETPRSGSPKSQAAGQKSSSSTGFTRSGNSGQLLLSSYRVPHARASPSAEDDIARSTSSDGSLVLRRSYTSSSPTVTREIPQLTAPPTKKLRWQFNLHDPTMQRRLRVVILLLKIISITSLCAPAAPNRLAQYPLLFIASLDVFLNNTSPTFSLILATLHVISLSLLSWLGVFCMPRVNVWGQI